MKNVFTKKELIFLIIIVLAFIVVALSFLFVKTPPPAKPTLTELAPAQKLNVVVIGKDKKENVLKKLGQPDGTRTKGNKEYMTYRSSLEEVKNEIALRDKVVFYTIEYTPNDKRSLREFMDSFGTPEIKLYLVDEPDLEWNIFLKNGFAIETGAGGQGLTKILRFTSQSKESFENNFNEELGLTKSAPIETDEY